MRESKPLASKAEEIPWRIRAPRKLLGEANVQATLPLCKSRGNGNDGVDTRGEMAIFQTDHANDVARAQDQYGPNSMPLQLRGSEIEQVPSE